MVANGKSWKMAMLKAAVQVMIALMGLAGVGLGVWAQIRASETTGAVRETADDINDTLVPRMDDDIRELRGDLKEVIGTLADVRERLARLETRRPVAALRPTPASVAAGAKLDKALKVISAKKHEPLPRLEIQQLAQPE